MRADLGPVVLTGAGGFVGRGLGARLDRFQAVALSGADWRERIACANLARATVFHLAARVHRPGDRDDAAYLRDNAEKTRVLAEAAAARGAQRVVFLSSIKVNAEESGARPVGPRDPPAPADAYARSKLAGEEALAEVARATGLAFAVVRSPLVVGAGARGNLLALLRFADSAWPLPFAAIRNRRTMIQVDDLADLLIRCALAGMPGRVYLAGDINAVTTPGLVATLRRALGRRPRIFAMPVGALEAGAALVAHGEAMRRLTRNLEIDVTETMHSLEWRPQVGIEAGLERMAAAYRAGAA